MGAAPLSALQIRLVVIGGINLLVWAFLLGRCSVHSRAADQQVQHVRVGPQAYPIGNDGDCYLPAFEHVLLRYAGDPALLHWRGITSPITSSEDPPQFRERHLVMTPDRDV